MAYYRLKCQYPGCSKVYEEDKNFRLVCDGEKEKKHPASLLLPIYERKQLSVRQELPGAFQFIDWLPTSQYYIKPDGSELGRPFCYKSEGLAKRLGLKNLFIAFSGYWPRFGVHLLTRTFKELEAQVSLARFLTSFQHQKPYALIIPSAGNTANGYNLMTHLLKMPLYLVVPETGLDKLLLPFKTKPFVVVVQGDYAQAIEMAGVIARRTGLNKDGGVRNVARRAGLGTVMLNAVANPIYGTHETFDHYFQAIGSGAGAIAAWEAIQLLLNDGRFGGKVTQIHVAQNAPFVPVCHAWKKKKRALVKCSVNRALELIAHVTADTLSNRTPCYPVYGGLFDVLRVSKGEAWSVDNYQVFHKARMFREVEGIDIGPSAAVAVDALCQAVDQGCVKTDHKILLHITGGGKEIEYSEGPTYHVKPSIRVKPHQIESVLERIGKPKRILYPRRHLKAYDDQPSELQDVGAECASVH